MKNIAYLLLLVYVTPLVAEEKLLRVTYTSDYGLIFHASDNLISTSSPIKIPTTFTVTNKNSNPYYLEQLSKFENIQWLKEVAILLAILMAPIFVYFTYLRKIKFDHIRKEFENEHFLQKSIQEKCHDFISKYSIKDRTNGPLPKKDFEELLRDICELDKLTFYARTDIANISMLCIILARNIIYYCSKPDSNELLRASSIYDLFIKQIYDIIDLSTKTIKYPSIFNVIKPTRKESSYFIGHKKLIGERKSKYFVAFEKGQSISPNNFETVKVFDDVMQLRSNLCSLASYRIFEDNNIMLKILYLNKVYIPIVLTCTFENIFSEKTELRLIGFHFEKELIEQKNQIKSIYVTAKDYIGLPNGISASHINKTDEFNIMENKFVFRKISKWTPNIISIVFEEEISRKIFKDYKCKIASRLSISKFDISYYNTGQFLIMCARKLTRRWSGF